MKIRCRSSWPNRPETVLIVPIRPTLGPQLAESPPTWLPDPGARAARPGPTPCGSSGGYAVPREEANLPDVAALLFPREFRHSIPSKSADRRHSIVCRDISIDSGAECETPLHLYGNTVSPADSLFKVALSMSPSRNISLSGEIEEVERGRQNGKRVTSIARNAPTRNADRLAVAHPNLLLRVDPIAAYLPAIHEPRAYPARSEPARIFRTPFADGLPWPRAATPESHARL